MALCLPLAACGGGSGPAATKAPAGAGATPVAFAANGLPVPMQCVPFVREIAGISIFGDAWTWWDKAAAQYKRGAVPEENAILVLRSTQKLPGGHVGIVRHVVNSRQITLTHANWGNDDPTRRLVHDATPVIDVSPNNDWSELRFWNLDTRAYGSIYTAYGFIYPKSVSADDQPVW